MTIKSWYNEHIDFQGTHLYSDSGIALFNEFGINLSCISFVTPFWAELRYLNQRDLRVLIQNSGLYIRDQHSIVIESFCSKLNACF